MRRLSHLRTILLFIKTPPWIPDSSLLSTAMSLDVCRLFLFLQSTDHQSQHKSTISSGSYSLPLPKSLFFFLELPLTPRPGHVHVCLSIIPSARLSSTSSATLALCHFLRHSWTEEAWNVQPVVSLSLAYDGSPTGTPSQAALLLSPHRNLPAP